MQRLVFGCVSPLMPGRQCQILSWDDMTRACRPGALYMVANGQGSPCLDLRRVPDILAGAAAGADLVIIEGMGRAVHTNLRTKFR